MKITTLRFSGAGPYVRAIPSIIMNKGLVSVKILSSHKNKNMPLPEGSLAYIETDGCRSLYDPSFKGADESSIRLTLSDYLGTASDGRYIIRKSAGGLIFSLRESRLSDILRFCNENCLHPVLIVPEGFGYYYAIKSMYSTGAFIVRVDGFAYYYIIDNKKLIFFFRSVVTQPVDIINRFGLKKAPIELSCNSLVENEYVSESGIDASLYSLVRFGKPEKEPFNFVSIQAVATAMEPLRIRRAVFRSSFLVAIMCLVLFITALLTSYMAEDIARLKNQLVSNQEKSISVQSMEKNNRRLFSVMKRAKSMLPSGIGHSIPLVALSQSVPMDLRLVSVSQMAAKRNVCSYLVTGQADNLEAVARYEKQLRIAGFKSCKLIDAKYLVENGVQKTTFKIETGEYESANQN